MAWIHDKAGPQIYWLNGLAGTGKSTIAKSVARLAAMDGLLGASFFCLRDEVERSDTSLIFPTLALQLSDTKPLFRAEVFTAIKERPNIGYALPSDQLQKLIIRPLQKTHSAAQPVVIIIDALDECKVDDKICQFLSAFPPHLSSVKSLKILITSRPECPMRLAFRTSLNQSSRTYILHDVHRSATDGDIKRYLKVRLQEIAKRRSFQDLSEIWPPERLVEKLTSKAAGLFIFASTACEIVNYAGDFQDALQEIAALPTNEDEGRQGIDQLYLKIVESAISPFSRHKDLDDLRSILGTIIFLQNPLSLTDLSRLLFREPRTVASLLRNLHSVLAMPRLDDKDGILRIIHASFRDFLSNPVRCTNPRICVHPATHHAIITMSLFSHMKQKLKRNICDIDHFKLNREVEDLGERKRKYIDGSLAYACRYWADHLECASKEDQHAIQLVGALDEFMRMRLLYWIEVLSLLGNMSIAVDGLRKAKLWFSVRPLHHSDNLS